MANSPSRRSVLKKLASVPLAGMAARASQAHGDRTHVAVIGAGAFGGWTAWNLLRKGAKVTLVDAWGPGHSRASSGGETRVIRSVYGADRIYVELVKRAFELWREAESSWKVKLFGRTGLLWMFSVDDAYARTALPIVRNLGFRIDHLAIKDAAKRYPQIDFTGINSCYFEHQAGYLMARRACQVVADRFQEAGGAVQIASVVPGRIHSGSLRDITLSNGSTLAADEYVFACGPWLGKLFPNVIGRSIEPTRQEVFFFGTPAGDQSFSESRMPGWVDFGSQLIYGIPEGADHRGFKVADDTRGRPFDPTTGDRTPTREGLERARKFLARRFPLLREAPLLEARVCQYENSPDGHFIIDRHPEAKNVWLAGGGSGHGFKFGPALGEYVAERVLGEAPIDPFFGLKRLAATDKKKTQIQ